MNNEERINQIASDVYKNLVLEDLTRAEALEVLNVVSEKIYDSITEELEAVKQEKIKQPASFRLQAIRKLLFC